MEERDRILIEKYLAQEMTATERIEFENRMLYDVSFRTEVDQYKLAIEGLKIAHRDELKERFRQRDKILDKDNTRHLTGRRSLWLLAAVISGVILLSWLLYYSFKQPSDEEIITKQDTLQQHKEIPITEDTTKSRGSEDAEKENKPIQKKRGGQELFAANFEAYTDESMDVAVRGDEEDLTPLERFQIHYWEKEHVKVTEDFSKMTPSQQQNDNLRFVYANSLMAAGRIDEAITVLLDIVNKNKSNYKSEAKYYLALAYLKKSNEAEARKHLEAYIADPEAGQKAKAKKILDEMIK